MSVENMVIKSLESYNLKLNPLGVECIAFQVHLLYGHKPTQEQVNEVVENNRIEILKED